MQYGISRATSDMDILPDALEAHDLVLTKLERNWDVDRQDVQALAAAGFLDQTTLRQRYVTEFRPNLPSGAEKNDLTLNLWIEICWPDEGRLLPSGPQGGANSGNG